jgi:monovalent cation:H+ antiporter-2, CPA2 family
MHEFELILTITGGLAAALFFGYLTQRLGLSPIVGYLVAGIVVGPNTPGFVANQEMAEEFAEIGVILLMFGVGLQFHFNELFAVRRVAVPGAICQSTVATLLGVLVAWWAGWTWSAGLVFGLAISVASTVVLLRVLVDNNDLHTPSGHIAVGWLVVEDLFTVFLLVLLPMLFGPGAAETGSVPLALGLSVLKITLLVVLTFFVGGRLIPRLLANVAQTHSRELFTLTVLVIALGIAVGSAKFFGVSMALGAFLAGMVVRQSDFSFRAASEALPMRDAFAVLFFVSVGMLFHPGYLLEEPVLVLATLGIILLGKPLAALVIVLALRYPPLVALSVAVALAQIGEFSFILATVGRSLGILGESASNALIAASIVSISLNPVLYRLLGSFSARAQRSRLWQRLDARAHDDAMETSAIDISRGARDRVVVVGYGPTGRTVARLLQENDLDSAIIELNLDTFRQLQAAGIPAVYGDATQPETLAAAGVRDAVAMILTSAGMLGVEEVIRRARELNPNLRIITRGNYLRDIPLLRKAGADAIFSGEGEVAINMTEYILRQLGATPEQIDRERDRIAEEFGAAKERSTPRSNLNGTS